MGHESYETARELVLSELDAALDSVDAESVEELIRQILGARQVFFVGVGRVLLSLQAFAKRLAHLGVSAHVVGDITEPAVMPGDLLIVGSGSGESMFPAAIAKKAKSLGATVAYLGSNPKSTAAACADLMVRIPVRTKLRLEGEIVSRQLMTSLFEQSLLLLGDIVAKLIAQERGLDPDKLWQYHANLE